MGSKFCILLIFAGKGAGRFLVHVDAISPLLSTAVGLQEVAKYILQQQPFEANQVVLLDGETFEVIANEKR